MTKLIGIATFVSAMLLMVGALRADEPDDAAANGALKPGDVLNQENWQLAEGLLPPEILKHYRTGEYVNPIVDWPEDYFVWPTDFEEGSKRNVGRFDIGPEGHVVEKATGEQPTYLIGFPFPTIDPADPKAGSKIIWNYYYRTAYFGNARNQSQLNWINERSLERRLDIEASWKWYDGVPEYERADNPNQFSVQFLTFVESPADLQGTASLTWRYRDPRKRDSAWAYVPALRRVRAVSPANRSDGFLGSDFSQDDGNFFEGKPEDFTWTLKGTVEQYRMIDPRSLDRTNLPPIALPDGGWRINWPDLPFLGYMDPNWKGVGWASKTGALTKRPHWVLEVVPKDQYYLFGKMEMYIDKITFQGAWNRKFSWKGELLNTYQVMNFIPAPVTGANGRVEFVQGSSMAWQCAENVPVRQATCAGIKSNPKSGFDIHVQFPSSYFDTNSLSKYGK